MPARVRQLVPGGVYAVFDHVAGRSVVGSWRLLVPGGTLVAYGTTSTRDDTGPKRWPVLKIVARTWLWNTLPNGRRAHFYNIRAGRAWGKDRFRARLRADLTELLGPDTRRPTVDAGVPTASELLRRSLEAWLRDPKAVAEARR
ncbi:hypothetical protein GCM10010360_63200 [Streptomyces nogalater]